MSPKIDGIRAYYYPQESSLISRQGKPIYGMDHILEVCSAQGNILDMELFIPGMEFNKMSGLIRNYHDCPDAIAAVFDTPSTGGLLPGRIISLNVFPALNKIAPLVSMSPVVRVPHYKVTTYKKIKELYARFVAGGYEGLVYKTLNHRYRNARSYDWMRMTPSITADVKVVKIYEGTGKMKGMAGGFYCEWNGGTCKVGTMLGIDYEARIDMFWNESDYIGRIAEIEFKNYQPSGKPRQPAFKRWRDDKC